MSCATSVPADRAPHGIARVLFAFFACLYLLTNSGRLTTSDGISMFEVTRSIVERRDLAIPKSEQGSIGADGRYYSRYGLMPSLLSVPFFVGGKVGGATLLRRINPDWITKFAVTQVNPFITAGTCVALFYLGISLGFTALTSLVLSLVYGLCTFAWNYTQVFFSEPMAGFFLLLAMLFAIRFRSGFQTRDAILWGLSMSFAILTKPISICSAPIILVGMLWNGRNSAKASLAMLAPIGLALVVVAWYNWMRFGSVLKTGYPEEGRFFANPLWIGLRGFLFSADRSIFIFNPILISSLFAIPKFVRNHRRAGGIILATCATWILLHAKFPGWHGGGCWGPRYLLPIAAFLLLPGSIWIAQWSRLSAATRGMFALLVVVSFLIQLLSISVSYQRHQIKTAIMHPPQNDWWDTWKWSPVPGQLTGLLEVLQEKEREGIVGSFQERLHTSSDRAHVQQFKSKSHAEVFEESIEMHSLNFWFVYMRTAGFPIGPLIMAVGALVAGVVGSAVVLMRWCFKSRSCD